MSLSDMKVFNSVPEFTKEQMEAEDERRKVFENSDGGKIIVLPTESDLT